MRIGAHAATAGGRERRIRFAEPPLFVEQLLWPVALQPGFELVQMCRILEFSDRDLMGTPSPFDRLAVDHFRSRPALGRAQHDHRPARARDSVRVTMGSGLTLDMKNFGQRSLERPGQQLVDDHRIVACDEMRIVTIAAQQIGQFLMADARQHRGVRDLETIEVQDRQHRAIARRVQEFVRVPARGQRPGLRFAVADHAGDDEIGIIKRRAVGVGQ